MRKISLKTTNGTKRPISGPMRVVRLSETETAHRNVTQARKYLRESLAGQGIAFYDTLTRQWIVTTK